MKKAIGVLTACMLVLFLFPLSPILAQEEGTSPSNDIVSLKAAQDQGIVRYEVTFNEEITGEFPRINLTYSCYPEGLDGEEASYMVDLSQTNLVSNDGTAYVFEHQIDFANTVTSYGTYTLSSVSISNDDWMTSQTYFDDDGIWEAGEALALTKENNVLEQITAEDLQVDVFEKQNFAPYLTTQMIKLVNRQTGEMIWPRNEDEVMATLTNETPSSGSGSKVVNVEYEIQVTSNETRSIVVPTEVAWYGAPMGTVVSFDEEHIPEYAVRYDKQSGIASLTDYYVRLNDGSVIKEKGTFFQGGGFLTSEAGVPYVEGGSSILVSLKYLIEDLNPSYTGYNAIDFKYRYYFVDDEENLVDTEGNIVVAFAQRKNVSYLSVNEGISLSSLEGTLPKQTTLYATEKNLDEIFQGQTYVAYDMTLVANYETVQPVGTVNVGMKLPEALKGKDVVVYYVDENGAKESVKTVSLSEEEIVFETDHFSTYSIVEKDGGSQSEQIKNEDTDKTEPKQQPTKQETPKTSAGNDALLWIAMTLIAGAALSACIWTARKKRSDK